MEFTLNLPVVFITLKQFIGLVTVANLNRWTLSEDSYGDAVFTKGDKELILSKGRYVSTAHHNSSEDIETYEELVRWIKDDSELTSPQSEPTDDEPQAREIPRTFTKVTVISDYVKQREEWNKNPDVSLFNSLQRAQKRLANHLNGEVTVPVKYFKDSNDWKNIFQNEIDTLKGLQH
jgi:effector-binding domain-containing protein